MKIDAKFVIKCIKKYGGIIIPLIPQYTKNMNKVRSAILELENAEKEKEIKSEPEIFSLPKQEKIAKVKIDPQVFKNLDRNDRNDKDIAKCALEVDGSLFSFVGEDLKRDKEMAKIAMNKNPEAFQYASELLKVDPDFVVECLEDYGEAIASFIPQYTKNIYEVRDAILEAEDKKEKGQEIRRKIKKMFSQYSEEILLNGIGKYGSFLLPYFPKDIKST